MVGFLVILNWVNSFITKPLIKFLSSFIYVKITINTRSKRTHIELYR